LYIIYFGGNYMEFTFIFVGILFLVIITAVVSALATMASVFGVIGTEDDEEM
jgi:hypothetical protein